jgi:hypothetical protein
MEERQNFGDRMIEHDENDHEDDEDENESESDEDLEDEDYDSSLKDDILRPASTRSKIVVNLEEPRDQ